MAIGDPTRGKARKPLKAANVLPLVRDSDPPEGWTPNCAFGLQRIDATPRGRTVRLEDVAVELAQTMGRQQVIDALFSALVADDGAEALQLHVLTANGYAKPLFVAGALNPDASGYWLSFDHLDPRQPPDLEERKLGERHVCNPPGMVARAIGWEWTDAWPGLSDFHTDSQAWTERIIAQNRAQPGTSARFDTEDRVFMLQLLRRLAVPVAVAHRLWGYGRVVSAAPETASPPVPRVPDPQEVPAALAWDGQRLLGRQIDLKSRGVSNHTQILQAESGYEGRKIRRLIAAERAAEAEREKAATDAAEQAKADGVFRGLMPQQGPKQ